MRAGRPTPLVLALMLTVLAAASLSAHRRDEYLQAARLSVEPRRVDIQVDLTPGIEVADSIIGDIDRNRDGLLSADEKRAYAASVLSALELGVDGGAVHIEPGAVTFPDLDAIRGGLGTIRLRTEAWLPRLTDGAHEIAFHNRYRPDVSVYLANALVPDGDSIAITGQRRDVAQRDLTIAYRIRSQQGTSVPVWLMGVLGTVLLVAFRTRQ